jgi:4-amino-4-deoxy-L-arabinose transferase-like glycosyltransferase
MSATARRDGILIAAVTAALLLPFAGKAFHMDDPLFIWAARHIRSSPADFYGFDVSWYEETAPMSEVMKNPPGASYYMALVSLVAGWSEVALHLAFLIPAVAAALGTYVLARRLSEHALLAALASIFTPAFLVSSTNVMSDTLLLAFWVWAIVLWRQGREEGHAGCLIGAAVLVTLAGLTKYYGVALVPLLAIDGALRPRDRRSHMGVLMIPVLAFAAYQYVTLALYGHGLLFEAASYAGEARAVSPTSLATLVVGLAFTGGCLAAASLGAFISSGKRAILASFATGALGLAVLAQVEKLGGFALGASPARVAIVIQLVVMAVAGLHVLALAGADARKHRNADAILLGLWIAGTFLFATCFNWTLNARALLPAAPAAGILLARRLDRQPERVRWPVWAALAIGGLLSVAVAFADFKLADAGRRAAQRLGGRLGAGPGTLWFEGHWGFQYYLERAGGKAIDRAQARFLPGDFVVVPNNGSNTFAMPADKVVQVGLVEQGLPQGIATMKGPSGAGFYSDLWGPLPFSIGPVAPDRYVVLQVSQEMRSRRR